jgi:hypothetical protein
MSLKTRMVERGGPPALPSPLPGLLRRAGIRQRLDMAAASLSSEVKQLVEEKKAARPVGSGPNADISPVNRTIIRSRRPATRPPQPWFTEHLHAIMPL